MNLATAQTIVTNWDKPIIRQAFWYLLIPAMVEIQRATPEQFRYFNARGVALRLAYLVKLIVAVLALVVWSQLVLPSFIHIGGQLILAYCCVMYGVWALAYWSMKMPPGARANERPIG